MTDESDKEALAQFSSRKGEAYRTVLAIKDDISRWMDEGWPVVAIFRLLRSKGVVRTSYSSFRIAVVKIIKNKAKSECSLQSKDTSKHEESTKSKSIKKMPHEMQRNKNQQFVTLTGVDHIGLDKKEE